MHDLFLRANCYLHVVPYCCCSISVRLHSRSRLCWTFSARRIRGIVEGVAAVRDERGLQSYVLKKRAVSWKHSWTNFQDGCSRLLSVASRSFYRVVIFQYFLLYFTFYSHLDTMLSPYTILQRFKNDKMDEKIIIKEL